MSELLPCPFCHKPLTVRAGINPYGRCDTEGCWMAEAKIGISCDDPKQVERWNDRSTPAILDPGLETVGYGVLGSLQLLEDGQILHATITRVSGGDYDEPVCLRSQAEELLAAERAEKEAFAEEIKEAAYEAWPEAGDVGSDAPDIIRQLGQERNECLAEVEDLKNKLYRAEADNAVKDAEIAAVREILIDEQSRRRILEAKLAAATADSELLNALEYNSWDLRCFDIPTGGDDADIGWRIVGHWQAKPHERTVAEVFTDNPRAAIRAALGGEPS